MVANYKIFLLGIYFHEYDKVYQLEKQAETNFTFMNIAENNGNSDKASIFLVLTSFFR